MGTVLYWRPPDIYIFHTDPYLVMTLYLILMETITKAWSPEMGTVLYWRPPDIYIFHTDPYLVMTLYLTLMETIKYSRYFREICPNEHYFFVVC